jgi:hypothetical protein
MSERPKPEIEVIRPEVEVLTADHSSPDSAGSGSQVWLAVDTDGGTRRVYVAKPSPIAAFLMLIAFGVLLIVSIVLALGLFALLLSISTVALTGLLIIGLCRWALSRLR